MKNLTEIAFVVKKNSDFYKNYMNSKTEKAKSHQAVKEFLKKYNLFNEGGKYIYGNTLKIELTSEQKEKFKNQICTKQDRELSVFKKTSEMNRLWNEEVYSKFNNDIIFKNEFWWFGLILKGSYSLWDYNEEIYGYLSSEDGKEISLPDYFEKIKISKYYEIIEEIEEKE